MIGRDGLLPHQFERISKKFGTPYVSIIVAGVIIVVFAGIFRNNIDLVASIANFGSLFTYFFVNISLLKLRRSEPQTKRFFKVPLYPAVPIIGAISCVGLMIFLSDNAKTVSVIWAVIGLTIYFVLFRKSKVKIEKK